MMAIVGYVKGGTSIHDVNGLEDAPTADGPDANIGNAKDKGVDAIVKDDDGNH